MLTAELDAFLDALEAIMVEAIRVVEELLLMVPAELKMLERLARAGKTESAGKSRSMAGTSAFRSM